MKEFCLKYKKSFVVALLFSLVCFGFMLTHFDLSIDEETWIMGGNIVGWLRQSRYTLWLYDLLFTDNGNYVPFLYDFLGICLWNIAGIILLYCYFEEHEINGIVMFILLAYYDSVPFVLADIMSFSFYLVQIGIATIFTSLSVYLTIQFINEKKLSYLIISSLLLWLAFGAYQALICYYVSAFAGYCVLDYIRGNRKKLFKKIITGVLFCVIGVLGYVVIDKIAISIVGSDGYLNDSYIGWKEENPLVEFLMSIANVGRVSFAVPYQDVTVNGATCIRILTILFVIYAFYQTFHIEKKTKERITVFLLCVALSFSPFFLYIAMATYKTVGRMMLGLPVIGIVQIYLISTVLQTSLLKKGGFLLSSGLLVINAAQINTAYFQQHITHEKDCELATEIMHDIQSEGIDYHDKPIVFIGMLEQDTIFDDQLGELGSSFFSHDEGNIGRMISFLRFRGYDVSLPSVEQINNAYQSVKDAEMNPWPYSNSIMELDDIIVVYLSEPTDLWFTVNGVQR